MTYAHTDMSTCS